MEVWSDYLNRMNNKDSHIYNAITELSYYATLPHHTHNFEGENNYSKLISKLHDGLNIISFHWFKSDMMKCLQYMKESVIQNNHKYIVIWDFPNRSIRHWYIMNGYCLSDLYRTQQIMYYSPLKQELKILRHKHTRKTHFVKITKDGSKLMIPCTKIDGVYYKQAAKRKKHADKLLKKAHMLSSFKKHAKVPKDFIGDKKFLIFVPQPRLRYVEPFMTVIQKPMCPLTNRRLLWHINMMIRIAEVMFRRL